MFILSKPLYLYLHNNYPLIICANFLHRRILRIVYVTVMSFYPGLIISYGNSLLNILDLGCGPNYLRKLETSGLFLNLKPKSAKMIFQ